MRHELRLILALWLVASGASASPVTAHFNVTNAALDDTKSTVSVPDFAGTVTLDLGPPTRSGVDFLGDISSVWEPPIAISFSTTTPLEAQLLSYYPSALTNPTLVAVVIENFFPSPFVDPSIRKSTVVLRKQYLASGVGLFQFEIVGNSDLADIPGFDAIAIRDPATFFAFAQSVGALRFNVVGYGLTYGNLYGDLTFESIGTVPLPPSLPLLIAGLGYLGGMSRRQRISWNR